MKKLITSSLIIISISLNVSAEDKIEYEKKHGIPHALMYEPIIDKSEIDKNKYLKDLNHCRVIGGEVEKNLLLLAENVEDFATPSSSVVLASSVSGAYLGSISGSGSNANIAAGAITGALLSSSVLQSRLRNEFTLIAMTEPKRVIENCLSNKNYKILNTSKYNGYFTWEGIVEDYLDEDEEY